jgi:hypothetical protein
VRPDRPLSGVDTNPSQVFDARADEHVSPTMISPNPPCPVMRVEFQGNPKQVLHGGAVLECRERTPKRTPTELKSVVLSSG